MKDLKFNSIQKLVEYVEEEACRRIAERNCVGYHPAMPKTSEHVTVRFKTKAESHLRPG